MRYHSAVATLALTAAGSITCTAAIAVDKTLSLRMVGDVSPVRSIGGTCNPSDEGNRQYCTENYKAFVSCTSAGTFQIAGLWQGIDPAQAAGECGMKNQECGYLPGDDTVSNM